MRDPFFPVVFVSAALVLLVVLAIVVTRRRKQSRIDDEAMKDVRKRQLAEAIKMQVLLPDGRPACVVCKNTEATESWPVVDTSWLDKVTAFKDLYALTPRYEVKDGEGERYELLLCPPHKRMCVQRWREAVARSRTKIQVVISEIEAEMAQLQGGEMLAGLQAKHVQSMHQLQSVMGTAGTTIPQLTAAIEEPPLSMPPMSTTQHPTETPVPHVEISPVHQDSDPPDSTDDG